MQKISFSELSKKLEISKKYDIYLKCNLIDLKEFQNNIENYSNFYQEKNKKQCEITNRKYVSDEVSISFPVNDETDKGFSRKNIKDKRNFFDYESKDLHLKKNKEYIDRFKYLKSVCASKNFNLNENYLEKKFFERKFNKNESNETFRASDQTENSINILSKKSIQQIDSMNSDGSDSESLSACISKKSKNKSRIIFRSPSESLVLHEFLPQTVELKKHKKKTKSSIKTILDNKLKIKNLIDTLKDFQTENIFHSENSDNDMSIEKLKYLNKILLNQIKSKRISNQSIKKKFNKNNHVEAKISRNYNSSMLARNISMLYSRPRLPPMIFRYRENLEFDILQKQTNTKNNNNNKSKLSSDILSSKNYENFKLIKSRKICATNTGNIIDDQNIDNIFETFAESLEKETEHMLTIKSEKGKPSLKDLNLKKEEISIEKQLKLKNDLLKLNVNARDVFDNSFQRIARQARITFINKYLDTEDRKYEANLPFLPEINQESTVRTKILKN